MKSKFNVIDVIIFTAVFAVCFSFIMLLIRDISSASYNVELTVRIENGAGVDLAKGESAELDGRVGKVKAEAVSGDHKYVTVEFGSTRASSMPKTGERISFTTKKVYAEGIVCSVTETEGDNP